MNVGLGNHLDHVRAARRVVERSSDSAEHGDGVDRGNRRVVHERDERQRERLDHCERLHDDQQLAFVASIGDETRPCAEEQNRSELAGRKQTESEPTVGQLQHQQRLGDEREPVADL